MSDNIEPDLDLVIEALRARSGQRVRAGQALSVQLAERRAAGQDVRSGALKIVDELAKGSRLASLADRLENGDVVLRPPGHPATSEAYRPPTLVPLAVEPDPATTEVLVPGVGVVDMITDDDQDAADAAALAEVDALLKETGDGPTG